MKVFRALGKVVKPFVNFPRWMGWNQIAADGKSIGTMFKSLTQVSPAMSRTETFEQAKERLNLSESDLEKRKKSLFQTSILYLSFAAILFIYAIYLLFWKASFLASIMALAVTMLALAFAYREHFWYFQISQRRLGCTFKEWFMTTFKGVK